MTPGKRPDPPKLFEIPTRLARAYRLNGQHYEAEKMYEWVLERHDSRFARVGLAAVYEDNGKHSQALMLYESVLAHHPRDAYALVPRCFLQEVSPRPLMPPTVLDDPWCLTSNARATMIVCESRERIPEQRGPTVPRKGC